VRCVQTRVLKSRKLRGEKGGDIGKFFARHIKLEVRTSSSGLSAYVLMGVLQDHVTYLRRTKIGAAVGTPGRLGKLLELGELTAHSSVTTIGRVSDSMEVSALTHIMIDLSYRDAKRRSVLDIPETRDEVFGKIFSHKSTLQGIKAGKVQIVLF
jgi:protein CMS1